jgi:hypothetical protein
MKSSEGELPNEYVSIRSVWLQAINDCRKAIAQRAIQEPNEERSWREIGDRNIVYTTHALYHSLCDYGEMRVRSDVDKYHNETYKKNKNDIWKKFEGFLDTSKFDHLDYLDREEAIKEAKKKLYSAGECWDYNAKESIKLYDYIIQKLNKYNMLFEEQPRGYSNVTIEDVK